MFNFLNTGQKRQNVNTEKYGDEVLKKENISIFFSNPR